MKERDAWRVIYKLYEEFAPALRQAAGLDDAELAGNLFAAAAEKLRNQCKDAPPESRLILAAGYDILDSVFTDAHKRAQERTEAEACGNPPPSLKSA